jgi:hypothetical protein
MTMIKDLIELEERVRENADKECPWYHCSFGDWKCRVTGNLCSEDKCAVKYHLRKLKDSE